MPLQLLLETMPWTWTLCPLCLHVKLGGVQAGRRTTAWSWPFRRLAQRPADKPESGPSYTQEFMAIMITRSKKIREIGVIFRGSILRNP